MNKLELFFPAKPYRITQVWGLYRPEIYSQFGFTRHNGEDIALGKDKKLYAPLDCEVVKIGNQPNGGGIFVGLMSNEYDFDDGKYRVVIDFLHCERILVNVGDKLKCGDLVAIADNTGFSTGPHTHCQYRRATWNGITINYIDKNDANNSFDPYVFFNGLYAVDFKEAWNTLGRIKIKIQELLKLL